MTERTSFFQDVEIPESIYGQQPTVQLGFRSISLVLVKLKGGPIEFSFNGVRVDGILDNKVKSITMDNKSVSRIWFRRISGSLPEVRIWAWAKEQA